jgi:hypothetical protein
MKTKKMAAWLLASVATATFMSTGALAATAKEQQLEARMEALERAFGSLQGELQTTKAQNAELRQAVVNADNKASEAVTVAQAAKATPVAPAADGFTVGSGATRVKIGGFIKTVATFSKWSDGDVAANSLGRDFYLPQAIPVGGLRESTDNDFSAKQTRLWLNLDTQIAGHTLKGYVETDFQTAAGSQGSERTTNGYNLALRRAYVQFDKLTVGQDWSTFQNAIVLPESTDFVGTTEGTVFVRQPLVRYSMPLGKSTTLHFGVENPETASANLGSPTLIENDDDRIPDFTARLNHSTSFGDFAVAGLVRQLAVDNGIIHDDAMAYGVSVSGKINFDAAKRYDLRFMATYGSGIGRYVGLNFAPDAIFEPGANRLHPVKTFASFAALRLGWTPALRSTLMASYQNANYPGGFAAGTFSAYNDQSWSAAGNLFWSPVKGFDLGVEYRHGERILVSGANGQLDRVEFAAKYSF